MSRYQTVIGSKIWVHLMQLKLKKNNYRLIT